MREAVFACRPAEELPVAEMAEAPCFFCVEGFLAVQTVRAKDP